MFYDKFIELCELKNEKPTPLLNKLNLSSGNLKRWSQGSNVSFDTIKVIADYFEVTIDYFFDDDSDEPIQVLSEGFSFKMLYEILKAHPDYIMSFVNGKPLDWQDYNRIAEYMNCSVEYLATPETYKIISEIADKVAPKEKSSHIPIRDFILNILGKVPESTEYRYLQVKISMIILNNLQKKNITEEKLLQAKLAEKKIRNLNDVSLSPEKKKGLNFSDLIRISEAFDISYDFMFTGNGE